MIIFILTAFLSSGLAQAESCKDISTCTELYEKLTSKKIETKFLPNNLSTLNDEISMSTTDAEGRYTKFINEAGLRIDSSKKGGAFLASMRHGDGINAPIYRVNEDTLNKIKDQNEKVNLIYSAKVYPSNIVDKSVREHLSKDKNSRILEFSSSKTILVSDFGKNAYLIIKQLEARDK